jgi:hypothetical protein
MGIVGDHPEGGVRFELIRGPKQEGGVWVYEGTARTSDAEHPIRATVAADGTVALGDAEALPKELAQRLTMLLRTVWKHASQEGAAPPRRVQRWRAY